MVQTFIAADTPSLAEQIRFVRSQTVISCPPLVPELRLHLAGEVTPLWHATERELDRSGLPPPYWAFAWPGGQALARLVLDRQQLVRGRRVLDFAAGSGLAAVAAMRAGAAAATASEIDLFACAAVLLNAESNGVAASVHLGDVTESEAGGWDVILAGDVCYERPMAERAFAWLSRRAAEGTLVLMGDPGRAYLPAGLREIARFVVPTSRDLEDREQRETRIFQLDAQAASTTRSSTIR